MKTKMFLAACCTAVGVFCLTDQVSAQALRVGDSFDLKLGGVPVDDAQTISSSYTIDGEGYLNIAYIGKMHIVGMTSSQVQSAVERAYRDNQIFTHPTVTLSVQSAVRFVNVSGAVKSPMRVPYTPDMTVMSAINAAGDFNDYGDPKKVHLVRGGVVKVINCKKARQDPSLDEKVLPGDSIQVPESIF